MKVATYLVDNEGYEENEAAALAINHTRRVVLNPDAFREDVYEAASSALEKIEGSSF